MLGKPEWFKRRKYSGWGLVPVTWQGWLYVLAIVLPLIIFQSLPFWGVGVRIVVTSLWLVLVFVDVFHIMLQITQDERERMHEAIAERNALWTMLFAIIIGILYQTYVSAKTQTFAVDPILIFVLLSAVVVKALTNLYLDKVN